jgi:hypothetical protein
LQPFKKGNKVYCWQAPYQYIIIVPKEYEKSVIPVITINPNHARYNGEKEMLLDRGLIFEEIPTPEHIKTLYYNQNPGNKHIRTLIVRGQDLKNDIIEEYQKEATKRGNTMGKVRTR